MVITETAGLVSVTVNLIREFDVTTHPVTAPLTSVFPGVGIETFLTDATAFELPTARVMAVGAVA